jgi:hypothetical protein
MKTRDASFRDCLVDLRRQTIAVVPQALIQTGFDPEAATTPSGDKRWDIKAIDLALDAISGLQPQPETSALDGMEGEAAGIDMKGTSKWRDV